MYSNERTKKSFEVHRYHSCFKTLYGELKFLRTEMVEMLMAEDNQLELAADYVLQQEQQEVQNPWLRELTDRFFN